MEIIVGKQKKITFSQYWYGYAKTLILIYLIWIKS
jgi:hypothetical protein